MNGKSRQSASCALRPQFLTQLVSHSRPSQFQGWGGTKLIRIT